MKKASLPIYRKEAYFALGGYGLLLNKQQHYPNLFNASYLDVLSKVQFLCSLQTTILYLER